jgi:hypothetical protein
MFASFQKQLYKKATHTDISRDIPPLHPAAASRRDFPPGNHGAPSQCKRAPPPPVCPASRREAVAVQLSRVTVSFRVTVPFPCPSEEAGADQRLPRSLALSFGSCEAPLPRSGWGPEFFQALPPPPRACCRVPCYERGTQLGQPQNVSAALRLSRYTYGDIRMVMRTACHRATH